MKSLDSLKKCLLSYSRADLERYYLAATWFEQCEAGYTLNEVSGKCVNDGDPTDQMEAADTSGGSAQGLTIKESDFMSAKKSCDMYETALISTRNAIYGEFDTALKNYIEDNIAKLISKKSRDIKTISKAFLGLKELNANIEADMMRMKAQARSAKTQAMMDIMQADLDLKDLRHEITKRELEQSKELAALYGDRYEPQIKAACLPKIQASMAFACGLDNDGNFNWVNCGGGDSRKFLGFNASNGGTIAHSLATAIANQSVFIDKKGNIISADPVLDATSKTITAYGTDTTGGGDTIIRNEVKNTDGNVMVDGKSIGKAEDFQRMFCADLPNFKEKLIKPLRADVNAVYNFIFNMNCSGGKSAKADGTGVALGADDTWIGKTLESYRHYDCKKQNKDGGCSDDSHVNIDMRVDSTYVGGDGKCYMHVRADVSDNDDSGYSAKSREQIHPAWETEYLNKGYKIFDEHLLPAFDISTKN